MKTHDSLQQWLAVDCRLNNAHIEPLPGDASFRSYYRLHHPEGTYIAMDASKECASCVPFVAIADALRSWGVTTPEIVFSDLSRGYLLLADFGDRQYLKELTPHNAKDLYSNALDTLWKIQQCTAVPNWQLSQFTADFMRQELYLFQEWFLEKYLSLHLTLHQKKVLTDTFEFLAEAAVTQPQVFMHRDYHSANLMRLPNDRVGVLDFQDAFIGPITYDLVSLLRDCYIAWPESFVTDLVGYFFNKLSLQGTTKEMFLEWFDLMGMQRHLKALLTFSRKYCRDQNKNYLQHIPRTLKYILTVSERYPTCRSFYEFLREKVIPCVA